LISQKLQVMTITRSYPGSLPGTDLDRRLMRVIPSNNGRVGRL
jgi:hypothetical protein